ncbi:MAG TPA: hypothetical protein PLD59_02110 [Tepidisphaeraceae bacterium]|nr:hypothetical protein [Tepidisphaeraceae bacterium]
MGVDQQGSTTQPGTRHPVERTVAAAGAESQPLSTPIHPRQQVSAHLLVAEEHFACSTLVADAMRVRILPSGCVYSIEHGTGQHAIQLNQVLASPTSGGIARLFLRDLGGETIVAQSIVGPGSRAMLRACADSFEWTGGHDGLRFRAIFSLQPDGAAWTMRVEVENTGLRPRHIDFVQLQDVALASRSQARNNELYNSQYLDHASLAHDRVGWIVMTRQNLPQAGGSHPWLAQGCYPSADGFVTDGSDFFGVGHRAPGVPEALSRAVIGTAVRQHETAYIGIQSAELVLQPGENGRVVFFSLFKPDHPAASSRDDLTLVDQLVQQLDVEPQRFAHDFAQANESDAGPSRNAFSTATAFASSDLSTAASNRLYPMPRRHEECVRGELHSFFCGDTARHVVLRAKECSVQRPHGHIVRSGQGFLPGAPLLSVACYAAGVFGSQITFGNSVLAKFTSAVRDPLNLVRSSGLRIFVRNADHEPWQILAVPSAFEMVTDGCRWVYRDETNEIIVSLAASVDAPRLEYGVSSILPVQLLVSAEIAAGPNEYDHAATVKVDAARGVLSVHPSADALIGARQPGLSLEFRAFNPADLVALGGDELLFDDRRPRGLPYIAFQTRAIKSFALEVTGEDAAESAEPAGRRARTIDRDRPVFSIDEFVCRVQLAIPGSPHAATLQDTLRWFGRDALVHLSTPRGLEQANGGAWGVRDVCQGPMEFLLSYGHNEVAAGILLKLFSQQYARRHDWPQWFMFAPYQDIQSTHCHGDVLIWPLKALCDYLEQTNDGDLLNSRVPYTDDETFTSTVSQESILHHVDRVIQKMVRDFVPGVSLPKFGDGDWDDSLQPADARLRDGMVSAWTTELMYQTLRRYAVALAHFGHGERAARVDTLASRIADDFQTLLMPGGTVAGFAVFNDTAGTEYLLHPLDRRTGLRYRLLPMTRGIISNIFSPAQAERHLQLIREHLLYPDGARLMDRPTAYVGGRETVFRRAESAAFFGREIGLQYVHAHLRYAEAMAVLGRADDLLRALLVVNPIAVTDVVPNARARQRNCFFSSSDAAFSDRTHASRDYQKLRTGEISVDGGWRIYSSGPGIYTNLVIRHLFGLRRYFDWVELDPVLPTEFDGAECVLTQNGRRVRYRFSCKLGRTGPKHVRINGITVRPTQHAANPYRHGGFRFPVNEFEAMLSLEDNMVEIDL